VVSRRPLSGVTSAAAGQARPRAASSPAPATVAAGSRVGVAARDTFIPPASWQAVEYYHLDALGSVRAVTNDQGAVIARRDFLPFGEEFAPQNPPKDRKLFTGQERDFETGLDYFNARQLRPDLGRFLAPDPLAALPTRLSSQGFNAYGYVLNNPLRLIDPSGLAPEDRTSSNPVPLALEESGWSPTDCNWIASEWGELVLEREFAMGNYVAGFDMEGLDNELALDQGVTTQIYPNYVPGIPAGDTTPEAIRDLAVQVLLGGNGVAKNDPYAEYAGATCRDATTKKLSNTGLTPHPAGTPQVPCPSNLETVGDYHRHTWAVGNPWPSPADQRSPFRYNSVWTPRFPPDNKGIVLQYNATLTWLVYGPKNYLPPLFK
jgi:RHS repeat-associated protein